MGRCSSSITPIEVNTGTKEVLHLGHAQELWGKMSWYHKKTADHEWKRNNIKALCSSRFPQRGNDYQLHPKAGMRGKKSISKYPSGKTSWNDIQQQFTQMGPGSTPSLLCFQFPPVRACYDEILIDQKQEARTDLNPSHIHCVSFCSWAFPGKWNRIFQLYAVYIGPFKKGENLEHSQKLYIKLKKIVINTSVCIFTTQQSPTVRFSSWHTGRYFGLLQHSCLQMWFF